MVKTKEKKRKLFSLEIPPELLEQAQKKSAETGIKISFIIRKAIADWVKTNQ